VSPNGSSVFAGQAKPNTYVTVLEAGKPVGSVKADANGEWSLVTEHRFASLEPSLSFETGTEPPKQVAAATPESGKAKASTAPAVTAELMKKLEGMVSQAREDAKAETAKKQEEAAAATPPPADTLQAPAASASPPAATASSPVYTPPSSDPSATTTASTSTSDKEVAAIPLPIMFVYDEAEFTPEGRRAADLLLEYLKLKHLNAISLTGHADERGSGPFNMDLSRERLDTVARYLREGGFSGKLDLVPKGESEPFSGVDRTKYAESDLFQLDRRVEMRVVR
jgi:outer membrane protein OmpA-like peptidoglycan-associated protein